MPIHQRGRAGELSCGFAVGLVRCAVAAVRPRWSSVQRRGAHPNVDVAAGDLAAGREVLRPSGDYATDVLGDPWDFSNDDDVPPIPLVGSEPTAAASAASATARLYRVGRCTSTTIKLIRTWGLQLPWGRDGLVIPVDAEPVHPAVVVDVPVARGCNMGIRFFNESGEQGLTPFYPEAGCHQYTFDLTDRSQYPFPGMQAPWSGKIVRLELLSGGPFVAGDPVTTITLDWVRLHRADAPGGADHRACRSHRCSPRTRRAAPTTPPPTATRGTSPARDDVLTSGRHRATCASNGGDMYGTTVGNDPFVEFPLPRRRSTPTATTAPRSTSATTAR